MKKTISNEVVAGWGFRNRRGAQKAGTSSFALLMAIGMAGMRGLGLLAMLTATGDAFARQNNRGTALAIRVQVQDYAQVPHKMLEQAERVATDILADTGIQLSWVNCPAAGCLEPILPAELDLRILPQSMAERLPASNDALGFTWVSTEKGPCYLANVLYHRVEMLADALACPRADILGYVMAHELGHLLLRSSAHSSIGIMRARATRKDLLHPWGFTPAQARHMRADVSARTGAGNLIQ